MAVITRVYANYAEARRAADAVAALNIPTAEASILGSETVPDFRDPNYDDTASGAATGAGVGAALGGGAGLLAGLGLLAIPGLGPIVAAGWLAATAAGAAGGALAGGAIGAVADLGVSDHDAPVFHEAIRRGSVAVSARFDEHDRARVEAALDQVSSHSYDDLRRGYESEGWRHDETEAERIARIKTTPHL